MLRILLLAAVAAMVSACSSRPLPKYEKPIARAQFQTVRTTAYTHSEDDHLVHGRKTCTGTLLRSGAIKSAAADWSRWPLGTQFRIQETGEIYEIDDIGWAISGRNTIDLYKTSRSAMNAWGVRTVNIEVLKWGEDTTSHAFMHARKKHAHCRRMLADLTKRIERGEKNPEVQTVTATTDGTPDQRVAVSAGSGGLRQRSL